MKQKIVDLKSAFKVYGEIDLLLGMRMHSNILAATQSTPFAAIAYEYKTEGISKQLSMEKYCIRCENVNESRLIKILLEVHANRSRIKNQLRKAVKTIQVTEMNRWNSLLSNNVSI